MKGAVEQTDMTGLGQNVGNEVQILPHSNFTLTTLSIPDLHDPPYN